MVGGQPKCPLQLHYCVWKALRDQYGISHTNPAIVRVSAPMITLVAPTEVEKEFGEPFKAVWVQYLELSNLEAHPQGNEQSLRPAMDKGKGIWDDFVVGGEPMRPPHPLEDQVSAYCIEELS